MLLSDFFDIPFVDVLLGGLVVQLTFDLPHPDKRRSRVHVHTQYSPLSLSLSLSLSHSFTHIPVYRTETGCAQPVLVCSAAVAWTGRSAGGRTAAT